MDRLALDPDGIAELAHRLLEQAAGGWSMGVQGALAEFAAVDEDPSGVTVRRSGRTVEAYAGTGGLRLTVTDDTQAFAGKGTVYLAMPRRTLAPPPGGVTVSRRTPTP